MEFDVRLNLLKAPKRACIYIMAFDEDVERGEPWVAFYDNKLLWRPWPGIRKGEEWRVTATLIYATWPSIKARVGSPEAEWLTWHALDLRSLIYVAEGNKYEVPHLKTNKNRVKLYTRTARKWLPPWPCDSIMNL